MEEEVKTMPAIQPETESAANSAEPLNTETIVKAIQLIALLQRAEERTKNGNQ
jgi:hypothetical protein